MKKRSKLGWVGVFIGTVIVLAVLNFLDARIFNQLNPFYKDTPKVSEDFNIKGTSLTPPVLNSQEVPGIRPEVLEFLKREAEKDAQMPTEKPTVEIPENAQPVMDEAETSIENSQLALARIEARTLSEDMKRLQYVYGLPEIDLQILAREEDPAAQSYLGLLYYRGTDTIKQDVKIGVEWIWTSAKSGYPLAYDNLFGTIDHAELAFSLKRKILNWMVNQSEAGDVNAQAFMGRTYYFGYHGIDKNKDIALPLLKTASHAGHANAQVLLAFHIMLSTHPEEKAKGVEWLQKAAMQRSDEAAYELAKAYEYGLGVEKDHLMAVGWYEVAVMNGHSSATINLMLLYFDMESPARDDAMARAYAEHVLEQKPNHHIPHYVMGELYRAGRAYPQNYDKAREHLEKASELNYGAAQMALAEMYLNGQGVSQDRDKAIKLLRLSVANYHSPAEDKLRNLGEVIE